jgi:hypothetical protein
MEAHKIALIKWFGQHVGMEILLLLLVATIIGVMAQSFGADTRDADPTCYTPSW